VGSVTTNVRALVFSLAGRADLPTVELGEMADQGQAETEAAV
jgi:hypothetical protein